MNSFEKSIKEQLLAYKAEIDEAKAAERMDKVSLVRTQMAISFHTTRYCTRSPARMYWRILSNI